MDVVHKKVTVLGAARSGVAVARMLAGRDALVFVSDSGQPEQENVKELQKLNMTFETGGHSDRVYDADFAVLSPGIPVASALVQKFYDLKIPVYSEVEAAFWFSRSPVIGVTGSNGKTTTTTLIGEMLKQRDRQAIVAGNIGQPFSESVARASRERWAVVELSSFQLETIDSFRPDIAVVLNFAPNHLDRYDSYDAYLAAKWRITKNMQQGDLLIYNQDDPKLSSWAAALQTRKQGFTLLSKNPSGAGFDGKSIFLSGQKLIDVNEITLRGKHNYMNVMAAVLAAGAAGINDRFIKDVLRDFQGVEHRLEKVAVIHDVLYVNDSKATTVESLMYALQSFENPVILIAGGKDKGSDFSRLNPLIEKHVKALVLIGTAASEMQKQWQKISPLEKAESMEDAVRKASIMAEKNDVVLLSPACASFDMFKNFEDRGTQFKKYVFSLRESV